MKRFEELDSLRGLAALSVVFCHFLLVYPVFDYLNNDGHGGTIVKILENTPLHLIWSGHEAVILFFMLSGFVLSLPYFNDKQANYFSFLIKRVCRIYIPYIIAVILSLGACFLLYKGTIAGLSQWFNMRWADPISLRMILGYVSLILIPSYSSNEYNPALWSLVHEMRISIIFPFMMILIKKFNWKNSLILGLIASFLGFMGKQIGLPAIIGDFFFTLQYLIMFVAGSLIAKHKEDIGTWFSNVSNLSRVLLFVAGLLCYTYSWWFFYDMKVIHKEIINDWVITIGAAVFMVFALYSKSTSRVLLLKPVHFLGEISYSLYLFHGVVFLSLIHIFNGILPTWIVLVIALFLAIGISTISYFVLEKSSIKLGRMFTKAFKSETESFKTSA